MLKNQAYVPTTDKKMMPDANIMKKIRLRYENASLSLEEYKKNTSNVSWTY